MSFLESRIFDRVDDRIKHPPAVQNIIWQNPLLFIAFGFGSGAIRFAPGTFGTFFSIPFLLVLSQLTPSTYFYTLIMLIILSSFLCDYASKVVAVHDHPGMCIDEFIGFFVAMFAIPPTSLNILVGFILFRLFDIFKPWPINIIDARVKGGFGMILDDVMAGIFSCILLQIFIRAVGY